MSMSLDKSLLEEVALEKGTIEEAFIEKDWFVTQVIKILAGSTYQDFSIVFTGGTCLSKAHKLIERFSEDIDFRVLAPSLEGLTTSKVKTTLSNFKKHIAALLQQHFEVLNIDARNGNKQITINLAYPTVAEPSEALRPHIKLELTLSKLRLPSFSLPVSSFINEVTGEAPEVGTIACISPVENAADKLSAMVWRIPARIRGEGDKQPDVVRHLHDLAKLCEIALVHESFKDLAIQTIESDTNRSETLAELSVQDKLSAAMQILESDPIYPQEYNSFVKQMAYNDEVPIPSFEEAMSKLHLLVEKIK
jgi:predicted nucleotidyltransferase component of viral defense system